MYSHILIPTDGSEVAQNGVDHGLSLAKALGARVTVIAVTERLPVYTGGVGIDFGMSESTIAEYTAGQKESANAALSEAKQLADRLGVAAETLHVPDAQPADAIIQAAASRNCSLIAMASHGRRGLSRLLLGSTTAEVLAHSSVPVLVVR
jgi:nucleotide-binding universal stress UspA family protein